MSVKSVTLLLGVSPYLLDMLSYPHDHCPLLIANALSISVSWLVILVMVRCPTSRCWSPWWCRCCLPTPPLLTRLLGSGTPLSCLKLATPVSCPMSLSWPWLGSLSIPPWVPCPQSCHWPLSWQQQFPPLWTTSWQRPLWILLSRLSLEPMALPWHLVSTHLSLTSLVSRRMTPHSLSPSLWTTSCGRTMTLSRCWMLHWPPLRPSSLLGSP